MRFETDRYPEAKQNTKYTPIKLILANASVCEFWPGYTH